ncbi:hypothetical protein LTR47_011680, partial [Exophiala xenobiotica]
LDADDYFDSLEEARQEWPYDPDPDYGSEEYYEHEDRPTVDEGYATAYLHQADLRAEARRKERQSWPEFWMRVLNDSPNGPPMAGS